MSKELIKKDTPTKKVPPIREKKPEKKSSKKALLIFIIILLLLLIGVISAFFLIPRITKTMKKEEEKIEESKEKKEEKKEEETIENEGGTPGERGTSGEGVTGGEGLRSSCIRERDEREIAHGESYIEDCSIYTCNDGYWAAAPDPSCCDYWGALFPNGYSWPVGDGCNTCTCNDGRIDCTTRMCP